MMTNLAAARILDNKLRCRTCNHFAAKQRECWHPLNISYPNPEGEPKHPHMDAHYLACYFYDDHGKDD